MRQVKSNDEILNKIMQTFIRETVGNIDELSLVLALQQHAPQVDLSAQFKGWNSTNVLAESNVPILFDILKVLLAAFIPPFPGSLTLRLIRMPPCPRETKRSTGAPSCILCGTS